MAPYPYDLGHNGLAAIENALNNRRKQIKTLETVFLIAICCQSGDKWQLKTLFLIILDLCSLILSKFSFDAYLVCKFLLVGNDKHKLTQSFIILFVF